MDIRVIYSLVLYVLFDRQDDYSIVIFLEHKEGPEEYYIAARIYINGWQIVLMNPDLY